AQVTPLSTALPHYYRDPDFSPRITQPFRSLPYSLAYPSGSSALRHEHHHREHDEISPGQAPLFLSVPTLPPCEGAAGLSPAREAPCWAHNPNLTKVEYHHQ
ncbi:MAG TPA: hypothetical protein VMO00_10655, partial [Methylomirabilota bacterium]|nr:hypothetical protein [Methylomirabilota bacterium]